MDTTNSPARRTVTGRLSLEQVVADITAAVASNGQGEMALPGVASITGLSPRAIWMAADRSDAIRIVRTCGLNVVRVSA